MRPARLTILAALLATVAHAATAEKPDPLRLRYCGILKGCGLTAPDGWCPADQSKGVDGVKYDD